MRLTPMAALLRGCDWCQHARGSDEAGARASLRLRVTRPKPNTGGKSCMRTVVRAWLYCFPERGNKLHRRYTVPDALQTLSVAAAKQLLLKRRLEDSQFSTAGLHMLEKSKLFRGINAHFLLFLCLLGGSLFRVGVSALLYGPH